MRSNNLILGLDIGVASVGWALLNPASKKIVRAGVRLFDAGVEGVVEKGKDVSRAAQRRAARLRRRQTERKVRRMLKVALILQEACLLPDGDIRDPQARHEFIAQLDQDVSKRYGKPEKAVLPYFLRARALDERLEPFELGRALYHLAQRRGFKSNRKSAAKETDKLGEVKGSIKSLNEEIGAAGARTLGEFFYSKKLEDLKVVLRNRMGRGHYTHRDMYKHEFNLIWDEQAKHHPGVLTDNLKRRLEDETIFFQRPLKSQKHLVGNCQLEPGEKRAPRALRVAQRFLLLETVNRLRIIGSGGASTQLESKQREALAEKLDCADKATFDEIRKWLKLGEDARFNLETEGAKSVRGNRLGKRLASALTRKKWTSLPEAERERIFEALYSVEDYDELVHVAMDEFGLEEARARKVADVVPEEGYIRFSEKALARLMPHLENGLDVESAIRLEYPESRSASERRDWLPPVQSTVQVRNPAVIRALTEVRKVVNAIIREHGLPDRIRVELARDMKRAREERKKISKDIAERTKERDAARERLESEFHMDGPKASDIEKYLLWRESGPLCVYCGTPLNGSTLFTGEVHVDHIIPRKLSLDNSFVNKVVCCSQCNSQKGDRTPHEAFSNDEQRWTKILKRAADKFSDDKRKRIGMTREEAEEYYTRFTESQLSDTKYASREAARYLGLLYGGRVDASGKLRVQVTKGGITSEMRNALQLNSIPPQIGDWIFDPDEKRAKNRGDHRQHAIDAIAIALSSSEVVKLLSDTYATSDSASKQAKKDIWSAFAAKAAWPGFLEAAKKEVADLTPSCRPSSRLRGPLHKENFMRMRGVSALPPSYREIGKSHAHKRWVKTGNNHHVEVVARLDGSGREVEWKGYIVTLLDAYERKTLGLPIVTTDFGDGTRFKFTIASGDVIRLHIDGRAKLFYVNTVTGSATSCSLEISPLNDALLKEQSRKLKYRRFPGVDALRKLGCRKVAVNPLGEVHYQND